MLVEELVALNAPRVLRMAAAEGRITTLECAMPVCECPQGRGSFDRRGTPSRGPWGPSADRWPVPGRDGGAYTPGNVRLAHWRCNNADGRRVSNAVQVASGKYQSDAFRERARLGSANQSRDDKVRGGRVASASNNARRLAAGGYQSDEWREAAAKGGAIGGRNRAHIKSVKAGTVGMCVRWNLNRGKPCVCGHHEPAQAAWISMRTS